ncbi:MULTISPECIES: transcriptional regulator SdiA [Raoultella]|jgi:LuxR family transcriptional regulator|uniref:N-3-oxohexanoyl-L-homoserine lactone quorum-sensing transcriptional activator n=1 Tax=Raoultella planticola TaxID=575 RepID=A0A2X2EEU6_RAOPL|nr:MULTISPECIES: transcriptional regulator SdiA [Raoultella]MDU3158840.1 transcriptional regulator SdiA [Hafnia alvei]MDU4421838.1 transcriptional regulator SdiA [Raoultella sp.]ATM04764.1 transcriptional regulator SdiA [Raoultella planticola]ATM18030.1 transcriptional regulator SdiA [Raoultella planticola]AUU06957.1 transcriptional regulator SdiA [Raoultella planticola]
MRDIDFFSWRREMLQQFQSITTGGEVYNLLQQQTEGLEYDYFALCVRHPVPFTRPRITLQSTYPQAWMTHYQAENYFAIDPVLRPENFLRGHLPWDDRLFRDTPELWDGARDHGLNKGVTQCLTLPNHAQGFLSVSGRSRSAGPFHEDEQEMRLRTLTELSLLTLLRLEDAMVMPPEMKFSRRELEILKWTAEGKTSAEVAIILSISENTVNFHQKNMQRKFNAPNKTQIACYAVATGLI